MQTEEGFFKQFLFKGILPLHFIRPCVNNRPFQFRRFFFDFPRRVWQVFTVRSSSFILLQFSYVSLVKMVILYSGCFFVDPLKTIKGRRKNSSSALRDRWKIEELQWNINITWCLLVADIFGTILSLQFPSLRCLNQIHQHGDSLLCTDKSFQTHIHAKSRTSGLQ